MSMSFGLGVNLSTSQKLTPQMQQAIRLLALSHLELEQEIQLKLDNNPLLERVEEEPEMVSLDDVPTFEDWTDNNWQNKTEKADKEDGFGEDSDSDSYDKLSQNQLDGEATDSDWENVYANDVDYDGDFGVRGQVDEEVDGYLGATQSTIQDHVRWQMNFKHLTQNEQVIAEYLIDAMDDLGYIRLNIDELHQNLTLMASFYQWEKEITPAQIMAVLKSIQECSPTGVGARNLAECLRIQLNERIKENLDLPFADEAYLVLSATSYLESNNIKALMQATGLSVDEIKGAMTLIRTLDPEPAASFYQEQDNPDKAVDIPDILVIALERKNGGYSKKSLKDTQDTSAWKVVLNPEVLPQLKINQEYASLIKKGDESPSNLYLKEHLTDARLFIRSIEERNQNLLKVATNIVQRQQAFFEEGVQALIPMTLKDIAQEVGLHESTVSRLTTNKTMLTPQGLLPLKYFFSSSVSGEEGDVSSTAISAKIRQMIADEDPKKPLSDANITKKLEAEGISISRRTVTKYRELMNIPSSTLRKQKI